MSDIKKAVLAYSGGLDTSVILKWLQDTYGCEIVTFTADLGQGEELEPARAKALQFGIKPENIFIDDLREEFVRDFVFPMFRANTIYEGEYLLGTSIARPLIAKRQIEIARLTGADSVSHGATGKGNDQVRFELGYYALEPGIKVIAPWREWDLLSRENHQLSVENNIAPVLHVLADQKLLQRAIGNLIRNTIRYAGPNATLILRASLRDASIVLQIIDNGPGVPDAEIPHLFEPFYRPDIARTRETGGVGLGLTIVKSCIVACGGSIVASNAKPQGFAIEITLPSA